MTPAVAEPMASPSPMQTGKALQALAEARQALRNKLEADPSVSDACNGMLALLRAHQREHGSSSRPVLKALQSATPEARWALALEGPPSGLARVVLEYLPHFGLEGERRDLAALACVLDDPSRTLGLLEPAGLDTPAALLPIFLAALPHQPILDFEKTKAAEVLFNAGTTGDRKALQAYEKSRAEAAAHARHHELRLAPGVLRADAAAWHALLAAALDRDPYGSILALRDPERPRPFQSLDPPARMDLLEQLAACGLGLASNNLDLFELPMESVQDRLERIFVADLTAGASVYGACALEGAHNYPFGLGRIEVSLPRRITSAEGLAVLKGDEPEPDAQFPRTFSQDEVARVVDDLQEKEARTFLERIKAGLFLEWKARFGPAKLDVVFGDPNLKIRNVLFLVAHATFLPEADFARLLQESGPARASATREETARQNLLACRRFFVEILGLNPTLLFGAPRRDEDVRRAPIEEVKEYRVLNLLHLGMSIHIQVGDAAFKSLPIAWNLLQKQGEGGLDGAIQDVVGFLDALDTLLVIARPIAPDLAEWATRVLGALAQGRAQAPPPEAGGGSADPLRLVMREAVVRHRDTLYAFCLQMLRKRAKEQGQSMPQIIQTLRLPRSKTDKLMLLLEEARRQEAGAPRKP